jgi:hypothetical protein
MTATIDRAGACGFVLATIGVVMAAHLSLEPTPGEALDGLVSGLWFAGLNVAGGAAARLLIPAAPLASGSGSPGRLLAGLATGLATWAIVGVAWGMAPSPGARAHAFAINSAALCIAGVAHATVAAIAVRRRRASS